jgi:hypothetical protein
VKVNVRPTIGTEIVRAVSAQLANRPRQFCDVGCGSVGQKCGTRPNAEAARGGVAAQGGSAVCVGGGVFCFPVSVNFKYYDTTRYDPPTLKN